MEDDIFKIIRESSSPRTIERRSSITSKLIGMLPLFMVYFCYYLLPAIKLIIELVSFALVYLPNILLALM